MPGKRICADRQIPLITRPTCHWHKVSNSIYKTILFKIMSTVHQRLSKHILADGFPLVMDMEKSHGSYIVDENGDEYLDMFSMFASMAVGYNHPHLVKHRD